MSLEAANKEPAPEPELRFWAIATSHLVVKRAARIALVVGTILAAINHGDHMLFEGFDLSTAAKILMTYCVPYSVSTYSSVLAIRENSITQRTVK